MKNNGFKDKAEEKFARLIAFLSMKIDKIDRSICFNLFVVEIINASFMNEIKLIIKSFIDRSAISNFYLFE